MDQEILALLGRTLRSPEDKWRPVILGPDVGAWHLRRCLNLLAGARVDRGNTQYYERALRAALQDWAQALESDS